MIARFSRWREPASLLLLFALVSWPALIGRYGFFADYQMLWIDRRPWPDWMPDHVQDVAVGRWLAADLMSTYLIWVRSFVDLDIGRAGTVVMMALGAYWLSRQLRRGGIIDPPLAMAVGAAVFLSPTMFRALFWITAVPQTVMGALVALYAWEFAGRSDGALLLRGAAAELRPRLMQSAFLTDCAKASVIVLAGCYVYAPAAMCFTIVPVVRLLAATPRHYRFARDAALRDLTIAGVAAALYFVTLKYLYQPYFSLTDPDVAFQLHQLAAAGHYLSDLALSPGPLVARCLWALEIALSAWLPPSLPAALAIGLVIVAGVAISWQGAAAASHLALRGALIVGFAALAAAPAVVAAPEANPAVGYVAYRTTHACIAIAAAAAVWAIARIAARLSTRLSVAHRSAFAAVLFAAVLGFASVRTTAALARAEWRDVSALVANVPRASNEALIVLTDFHHAGSPEANFDQPWQGALTWPLELSCFSSVCTADTEIFRYALRVVGLPDWASVDIRVAERAPGDDDCAAAARRLGLDLVRWHPVCVRYAASWLPRRS
ncbi:MAG TPA: hypothetical protein VLV50_14585 [Stellaceae bacterium]|nr:hypothetical protein [Stellaceae bacterium]